MTFPRWLPLVRVTHDQSPWARQHLDCHRCDSHIRWHHVTSMRNFCECVYGLISQLIQMGKFSLMNEVPNGTALSEGTHLSCERLSHWPERQMLSGCELSLEEAVGKDLKLGSRSWGCPQPTADRVASSLTAWLHFWCWAENLAKLSRALSQYFEIINVFFQDIKLKVFYAQVENEYNLFSLSEKEVQIIPLRIYYLSSMCQTLQQGPGICHRY